MAALYAERQAPAEKRSGAARADLGLEGHDSDDDSRDRLGYPGRPLEAACTLP